MGKTVLAVAVAAAALSGAPVAAAAAATGAAADWRFLQNADAVSFDGETLSLRGIHPQTILVADRPRRLSGDLPTAAFVSIWRDGGDSLRAEPAGASLSVVVGGREQTATVALSTPRLDGDTLRYAARVIDGSVPPQGGFASLSVGGGPADGVSRSGPWGGVRCWQPW